MIITDFLERNARLYGGDCAPVETNPSEARAQAPTCWAPRKSGTRLSPGGTLT